MKLSEEQWKQSMLESRDKCAGVHFGNRCDIINALLQFPQNIPVGRNEDPAGVLKAGSPADVTRATLHLLEQTARYSNFFLSSGCYVAPNTPLENILALFAAHKHFNTSKR